MPEMSTSETEEVSFPAEEIEEGKAVLVVKKGPEAGTNFFLEKDVVTCGRDAGSDIFLDDVTVPAATPRSAGRTTPLSSSTPTASTAPSSTATASTGRR